ncbi:MAG: hypothetical protein CVU46_09505 [Chloroflexi bacterium HGW-Chloroflexi-8]|nr:MAG: hypothetical protein CVU46_09505 [Chloroflexi bacterium HGW-Chloroflexi-8]
MTLGVGATLLVLAINVDIKTNVRAGTPTYNGVNFTKVSGAEFSHPTGEMNVEVWYLLAPSTGASYNISIPNASSYSLFCQAFSFAAANSSVFDTYATATQTGTVNPEVTINTEGTGELVIGFVGHDVNAIVVSAFSGVELYTTDHGAWGSSQQYVLSSGADPLTMTWTSASNGDRIVIAIAFKDQAAIVIPTVTTSATSSVTETGATGNGEITALGGENATRRGFCFMTGTSGDPTTANSVVFTDGSFAAGTFSQSLGALTPGTNYRVRAYANNSAGTGYGTTVQLLTHDYPTITPNTTDAFDFGSDDTPTLEFTGSDPDADDLQYEIQISNLNTFPSASAITKQNIETDTGTVHANNISGSGTEDDRPGNSFLGSGGILDKINLKLGIQGTVSGNFYLKIYEIQGTFGTNAEPLNAAEPASTPTPGYIAISDAFAVPGDLTTSGVEKTFTFSGANRIRLLKDHAYYFILNYVGTGDASNAPFCSVTTAHTYEGDCYNDGKSVANNGYVTAWEVWFKLYEEPVYYDKVSNVDAGFVNTVDGGDTNPFTAGQKVSYTVQAGSEIPATGTYYWQARVKDPSGSNIYSGWTTTRTFTVTLSTANEGVLSKTFAALALSAAGTVDIAGDVTKTLAALASSAIGTVDVIGNLSRVLAGLSLSADGTVGSFEILGELSKTLTGLTLSGIGTIDLIGTLAKALAGLTSSGNGTAEVQGTASKTLAVLTSNAQGTVEIQGAFSHTSALITINAQGAVEVQGSASKTLASVTVVADGIVGTVSSVGDLNQTLASLSSSGAGTVTVSGLLSKTLALLTGNSVGNAAINGDLAQTLGSIVPNALGNVELRGLLAKSLNTLTLVASGSLDSIVTNGQLDQSLASLSGIASGAVEVQAGLAKLLTGLSLSGSGAVDVSGLLSNTLGALISSGVGEVFVNGSLNITLIGLTLIAVNGQITDPVQVYGVGFENRVLQIGYQSLLLEIKAEERKVVALWQTL